MSKIAVVAKLVAKEGKAEEVEQVLRGLVDSAAPEEGTEIYALSQDLSNPETFWFFELYTDHDALGVHGGSKALADAFTTLSGSLAAAPELNLVNPLAAKGIDL